ncbi:hypothetical protein V8G54_016848 [Vigna mungo]|uniref:Uncharacterized protein n=1 Tax=Vigna mungo TaxID=3915 RepID=A0AAQ3S0U1_VIGMU
MSTHLSIRTRIVPIIVPLTLFNPCTNSLCWLPPRPTPPEYVLTIRSIRMLQGTITAPLVCIPLGVSYQFVVPHQGTLPHRRTCCILGYQKLVCKASRLVLGWHNNTMGASG